MKIEIPLAAGLLLFGTVVLARIATQGVEQALVTTAIEHARDSLRGAKRLLGVRSHRSEA